MATIDQERALAMARARLRLQQPEEESPYSVENLAGAAVEPMMAMGSGMAGTIAGGLMGLGTIAGRAMGLTEADPTEVIHSTQEAMTYQPRTEGGKTALDVISYPFRKYAEGTEYLGGTVAEREARMGSSTEAAALKGTLTKTALDVLPMMVMGRATSKKPSVISPKVEEGIKGTVKYIPKKLVQAAAEGKKILSHRLPGGTDRAVKDILPELVGERMPKVIKALEKGKELETAGQAAARAGSYEFSALQKMVESRKPSEYGDVSRAQQHARLKTLKKLGGTPEELRLAESLMRKHATEGYGKVKGDLIDPRSPREILVDAAMKAEAKAKTAEAGKVEALRDWGRFKTLESQQKGLAGKYTPVRGYPRVPERYAPHTPVAKEANKAAIEVSEIAKARHITEKSMSDISETMLLNTLGETGPGLGKWLSRPSVKKAIRSARKSAEETGSYFPKSPDEKFSVANLQRIKRAVAENMQKQHELGSLGKTEQAEIKGTLTSFTDWLRTKSQGFAKAEDIYAQEVKRVNRMKVLQSLSKEMQKPLGDKEPAAAFSNKVKDSASIVKDELGNKIPIHETLKQKQINAIDRIQREYNRDAMMEQQASKGMQSMNEVLGTMHDIPRVHILKTSIVIMNSLLKKIEGVNTKATLDRLTELMKPQNKAKLVEMMKAATPKERSVIMQGFGDQATVAAAIAEAERQ